MTSIPCPLADKLHDAADILAGYMACREPIPHGTQQDMLRAFRSAAWAVEQQEVALRMAIARLQQHGLALAAHVEPAGNVVRFPGRRVALVTEGAA
jgi:hypothetical protein